MENQQWKTGETTGIFTKENGTHPYFFPIGYTLYNCVGKIVTTTLQQTRKRQAKQKGKSTNKQTNTQASWSGERKEVYSSLFFALAPGPHQSQEVKVEKQERQIDR